MKSKLSLRSAHRLGVLLAGLLAGALLLAACRADQPTPTAVPAYPAATTPAPAANTPTPTTPAPAANPSPSTPRTDPATVAPQAATTPAPADPVAVQLAQADRYLHNGQFAAAAGVYQTLLDTFPAHTQAPVARLGLGKALLWDGQARAAAAALEPLAADAAFLAQQPEALFWLGRAAATAGDAAAAAAAFDTYASRQPQMADRAHEAAGDAYLRAHEADLAQAHYQQALTAASDLLSELRAREGLAASALLAGQAVDAAAQYQTILSKARNAPYRAEMLYRLGQAQQAAGEGVAARASFLQAASEHPEGAYANLAVAALTAAGQPVDDLLAGRVAQAAGSSRSAIDALHRYLDAHPEHDGEAHALAARSYEALGDYQSAEGEWRALIETHPNDSRVGEAWLGRGRCLWREGDLAAARAVYLAAAQRRSQPEAAAEALWWAGLLAEREEELIPAAAADFTRLARDFPTDRYALRAAFRAGLQFYRLEDYEQARAIWTPLAAAGADLWHAAADFWLGKLLLAAGDEAGAIAHWQGVAERWSASNFYGLRSREEVARLTQGTNASANIDAGGADATAVLNTWLLTWAGAELPADPSSLPELARPTQLHRIGETAAARTDFEALRQSWADDPISLLALALAAHDLGYYDTSIRAAARVTALTTTPFAETPLLLQRLVYPLDFPDLILAAAVKYAIEPPVYFALIRQESLFGSAATSSAAASGLAQVIPSTGRSIAEQLRWPNYRDELLYRPYVSAEFGAFYLRQGIDTAGGSLWQALAGYNAGPGNAGFWRRLAGTDEDLFLELITFNETQTYVRTIAVQAAHYRRLYPDLSTP